MSKVHEESIICPNCKAKGKINLWDSMNVDIDPELREKIFTEEAFIYTCPECGHHTGVPYGTLYHDMKHRFMLFFDFFKTDDFNNEPVDIPDMQELHDYTYRHVIGLWRLKEKIVILEHGLNDVAIEHQKYMISHVIKPEIAEKGYELFFGKTEEPNEEFPYGTIYFFYDDEEEDQTIQIRFAMDNYYEHKLACELDPRMKVEGCICVDADWMAKQMKEE